MSFLTLLIVQSHDQKRFYHVLSADPRLRLSAIDPASPLPRALFARAAFVLADPNLLAVCAQACHTVDLAEMFPRARFIQATWAGVESLMAMADTVPLVRFAGDESDYGEQMAEWVFAQLVFFERTLGDAVLAQRERAWRPNPVFSSWRRRTMGILGFGAIGRHVARVARAGFGMHVKSLARGSNGCEGVVMCDMDELLGSVDVLVCLLPSTPQTRGLLDNDMLSKCQPHTIVMNAGRGDLLSEASILKAVRNKNIRGFIGDVWPEEPLPASSPLWNTPGIVISPHVAAKPTPAAIVKTFTQNIDRSIAGQPFPHLFDRARGY